MRKNYFGTIAMMALVAALMVGLVDYFLLSMAYAQEAIGVPEVNVLEQLGKLVLSWSTLGVLGKGVLFVTILVQVLKQSVDFKYKRSAIVVLSILYGVGQLVLGGETPLAASMAVLVSGGGAMALYESLKPVLRGIPFFSFLKLGEKK